MVHCIFLNFSVFYQWATTLRLKIQEPHNGDKKVVLENDTRNRC